MRKLVLVLALSLTLALGIFIGQAVAEQSHMVAARDLLRQAREELQKAEHDKGGHRGRAVNLVTQAIAEVNAGIKAGAGK